MAATARGVAERVARESYGKLLARLAARTRDIAAAEDALSDAFAAALATWPVQGTPDNPEGWLVSVAKRRTIDLARRRKSAERSASSLELLHEELAARPAGAVPDERLPLMFACAHPALAAPIRAPLILQTILGFDAATIASAFLVAPATMMQRLVRAKGKLRESGVAFEVPEPREFAARLPPVLEAIYAVYAEGWLDPAGADPRRRELADEGIWLGRLAAAYLPTEAEALGLLALMLYAHARRDARRDAEGRFVPLAEQDSARWDGTLIDEAEALLIRASALPGSGRFQLEAAIQSAHSARRKTGCTDWHAIQLIYDRLLELTGSPVVAVNRALALSRASDARAGLAALDACAHERPLRDYQPYWAARADLLARLGQLAEADGAYERAIGLEPSPEVRRFLEARRARLACAQHVAEPDNPKIQV